MAFVREDAAREAPHARLQHQDTDQEHDHLCLKASGGPEESRREDDPHTDEGEQCVEDAADISFHFLALPSWLRIGDSAYGNPIPILSLCGVHVQQRIPRSLGYLFPPENP